MRRIPVRGRAARWCASPESGPSEEPAHALALSAHSGSHLRQRRTPCPTPDVVALLPRYRSAGLSGNAPSTLLALSRGDFLLENHSRLVAVLIACLPAQLLETGGELPGELGMRRVAMQIVQLLGILLQVVELELLRLGEIMDVLVALRADTAAGLDVFVTGIFIVFIEPVGAPCDVRVGEERHEALTLIMRGRLPPDEVQQCRRQIEIEHHAV